MDRAMHHNLLIGFIQKRKTNHNLTCIEDLLDHILKVHVHTKIGPIRAKIDRSI